MVEYKHLWVGEQFKYEGTVFTKSNHKRCFYFEKPGNGARPIIVWKNLPKNRMVEPLTERYKNG